MISLLLFILIISFIEGWSTPLVSSVVPRVVPKDDLVKANSSLSVTNQSVQLAGYSFTGLLVVKFGHLPILIAACILFWLSTVSLYLATSSFGADDKLENGNSKWGLIKEGWLHLWKNPTLRIITIMDVIEGMAGTIWVGAITLVYVTEALHKSEQWWGYINSSYYIGTIVGGFFTLFMARRIQKNLILSMAIGSFLFSFFTFLYGMNSTPYLSLLLCIAMGPAYQLRDVAQQTAFQTSVDSVVLTKVYASRSIVLSTITSCSIALIGFIADTFGIRSVYIFGSVLIAISALLSFTIVGIQKKNGASTEVSL